MITELIRSLTGLNPIFDIFIKLTVLLLAGWGTHVALRRANPRWRILLWRGVGCGMVLIPILVLSMPKIVVPVRFAPKVISAGDMSNQRLGSSAANLPDSLFEEPMLGKAAPAAVKHAAQRHEVPASPVRTNGVMIYIQRHAWVVAGVVAGGLWGLVVFGFAAMAVRRRLAIRRILKNSTPVGAAEEELLRKIASDLGTKCPELRISHAVGSPVLCGIRRPIILLPENTEKKTDAADLTGILAHELTHLKSNDLFWSSAVRGISALLWFHPLVWGMRQVHAFACELVCDRVASEYVGNAEAYSRTLADVALAIVKRRQPTMGIPMARRPDILVRLETLKQRLSANPVSFRGKIAVMIALGALAILLGGLRFASAGAEDANSKEANAKITENSISTSPSESYKTTLGDKIQIELLAVSNQQWEWFWQNAKDIKRTSNGLPGYWWLPNGQYIEKPTFKRHSFRTGSNFDFLIRVSGIDDFNLAAGLDQNVSLTRVKNQPAEDMEQLNDPKRDWTKHQIPGQYIVTLCDIPQHGEIKKADIAVGISYGPWKDVYSWDANWKDVARQPDVYIFGSQCGALIDLPREINNELKVNLTQTYIHEDTRLIAVDHNNKIYLSEVQDNGDGRGLTSRRCTFKSIGLNNLKLLTFQKREFHWVTIPNVVMLPPDDVALGPYAALKSLEGQNAPEFKEISGWKNCKPFTLAEMRRKVVLLNFFSYGCNDLEQITKLMNLHDRYANKGLMIIGIHGSNVQSIEEMEEKLKDFQTRLWGNRAIPYPLVLEGGGQIPIQGTKFTALGWTSAAYGASDSYPITVLIDKQGKIKGAISLDGKDYESRIREELEVQIDDPLPGEKPIASDQSTKSAAPVQTVANELVPVADAKEHPLLKELREMQKREGGRDNAMIHYLVASDMMGPLTQPNVDLLELVEKVRKQGWSKDAEVLLPYFEKNAEAFTEIRNGAALDYVRNAGVNQGSNSPTPNFLNVQIAAKLLCAQGRYFETQGKYGKALDNYLVALKMGHDYGMPETMLIGGLIAYAVESIVSRQIIRLVAEGHLNREQLSQAQQRLKAITETQPTVADLWPTERKFSSSIIFQIRSNPEEARKNLKAGLPNLDADDIIRSIDRIESEMKEYDEALLKFWRTPYWQRDSAAHEREMEAMLASFHPVLKVGVPNFVEADTRCLRVTMGLIEAQITVALAQYKLEHGTYPAKLSELTPRYLDPQPTDAFSGKGFNYQLSADGAAYTLWSTGPDKQNDNAAIFYDPTNGTASGGDIIAP